MLIGTKVVAFDFDEVIVRGSETLKRTALEGLFPAASKEATLLVQNWDYFLDGKGNRFDVFAKTLGVTDVGDPAVIELGDLFNEKLEGEIHKRGIHTEDRQALVDLGERVALHVNSNTPEVLLQRNIEYFSSVYPELCGLWGLVLGSPRKKVENLGIIRGHEKCLFSDITMVGDGENDLQAALEVGCHFIGVTTVDNRERWSSHAFPKVDNIAELRIN